MQLLQESERERQRERARATVQNTSNNISTGVHTSIQSDRNRVTRDRGVLQRVGTAACSASRASAGRSGWPCAAGAWRSPPGSGTRVGGQVRINMGGGGTQDFKHRSFADGYFQ